jgi:hypothetical protein
MANPMEASGAKCRKKKKNFLWRACHEILPTKHNLFKRKITSDPLCPICGLADETSLHILFFAALVRRIWFRGRFAHPDTLIHQAAESVAAYASAQVCISPRVALAGNTGWKAPQPGWFKLNWDAAIGKNLGITGMGVVARDCEGRVFAAKCQTIQGCMDILSAEAWAGVQAIKFGEELRIPKLYLEGDAQGVVEAVNAEAMNWSRIGHLVDDVKLNLVEELFPVAGSVSGTRC